MGMRLEGPKIENIVDTNIKSEGLIKGVIQVPADGNPIIMLSDHGTIGGYPKIGVVISADYDKLVQLSSGSKIKFQEIELSDRMGMRLEGEKIENIVNTNIKSEGLLKGVIQVPADGNPIIMLSDHGTIGGYPKIGVVISADYDKLVQLTPGTKIKFENIELSSAETLFKLYELETQNLISQI